MFNEESNAATPEPMPVALPPDTKMRASAHWQVMRDLSERAVFGIDKYDTLLTIHSARKHLIDMYQEELDKLVYFRLALNKLEEWSNPFETLKAIVQSDSEVAWSWHCVIATCLWDKKRLTLENANLAAVDLMEAMFATNTYHQLLERRGGKMAGA